MCTKLKYTKKVQERLQEKAKALFVRLPQVIRNPEDVAKLFTGDFKVKLTRQTSKHCYVVFSDKEEKMKNLKAVKGTKVNGKRIVVAPANTKFEKENKISKKKVVVPQVKPDPKVTKKLFVSNIKCGTKRKEIMEAIPGCVSVKLLPPYTPKSRGAIVKMESIQISSEYLSRTRDWPTVGGRKLRLNPDTRTKNNKSQKSNETLKIYDGEPEVESEVSEKRKGATLDDTVLQKET